MPELRGAPHAKVVGANQRLRIVVLGYIVRGPLDLGRTVLAGGLTLSLVVLPVVIVTAREGYASWANPGPVESTAAVANSLRRRLWQAPVRE